MLGQRTDKFEARLCSFTVHELENRTEAVGKSGARGQLRFRVSSTQVVLELRKRDPGAGRSASQVQSVPCPSLPQQI